MPPPAAAPIDRERRPHPIAWIAGGLCFLLGTLARTWNLPIQAFGGDEVHAVHSALRWPVSTILVTYRLADHCIPLAAYDRLLLDAGLGLTEIAIRLPAVLAGIALVAVLPLLAVRRAPRSALPAVLYCALLAISPSLLYYSRIARPYAIVALLAPLAAAAFWRWWRGGGHGWALAYVAAGGLAGWFHLGTVPFVAAPLAYGAAELAWDRSRHGGRERAAGPSGWGGLAAAGCGLALALAAFLAPAGASLLRLVRSKAAAGPGVGAAELWAVARLQAGVASHAVALLFWLAVAASFAALLRRAPRTALYGAALVACQWIGILGVLRPAGIQYPVALARYLLVTVPVLLLALAWGLARLVRVAEGRWRRAGTAGAALAVVGLAAAGPYAADPGLRFGPFAGHEAAAVFIEPSSRIPPEAVPPVYSLLAREPGEGAVLEITRGVGHLFQVPALTFQRVHRRPVIVAFDTALAADPRLRLWTVAPVAPAPMLASGARFVVLHLDPPRYQRIERHGLRSAEAVRATPAEHPARLEAAATAAVLEAAWGEPDLVDGETLVWDLARRRQASAR